MINPFLPLGDISEGRSSGMTLQMLQKNVESERQHSWHASMASDKQIGIVAGKG